MSAVCRHIKCVIFIRFVGYWLILIQFISLPICHECWKLSTKLYCIFFIQVGCEALTPSPGHDVTGQKKNLGREWKADAVVYSRLPSPPALTMHGLPPQLLVQSVNVVMGLAHTPVHHWAGYSQCHPGDPEEHQNISGEQWRGTGELISGFLFYIQYKTVLNNYFFYYAKGLIKGCWMNAWLLFSSVFIWHYIQFSKSFYPRWLAYTTIS